MPPGAFHLPAMFDLCATFAFALTGALAAIKRGYDIVGVFFLALACGIGGGLIRDGVLLPRNEPTPLLADPRYILVVLGATVFGALFGGRVRHLHRVIAVLDALGLGAYAAFGTQKALNADLAVPAAVLVGVVNAAGGGLLRDIITREEPLVFKPGQFYVLTAFGGSVMFVFLSVTLELPPTDGALGAVALTFILRAFTIAFNWRTQAVVAPLDPPAEK
jgi:uncharacterized membrane protein YeiH